MADNKKERTWEWTLSDTQEDSDFTDIDFSEKEASFTAEEPLYSEDAGALLNSYVDQKAESLRSTVTSDLSAADDNGSEMVDVPMFTNRGSSLRYQAIELPQGAIEVTDEAEEKTAAKPKKTSTGKKKLSKSRLLRIRKIAIGCVIGLLVLLLLFLIIQSCGKDNPDPAESTDPVTKSAWTEESSDSEVYKLISRYLEAKKNGDSAAMKNILVSGATINTGTMSLEAQLFEDFKDLKVYSAAGVNNGDKCISAFYNTKYRNVDTEEPSQEWLYAEADSLENLRLKTNVEYSPTEEELKDSDNLKTQQYNKLVSLSQDKAMKTRCSETEAACKAALQSDPVLAQLKLNISNGIYDVPTEATEPSSDETDPSQPSSPPIVTDPVAPTAGPDGFYDMIKTMYICGDSVRLRSKPDTSDDMNVIDVVGLNTALTVTGYNDEWYRVVYNGSSAYVFKDFVSPEVNMINFDATMYINYYRVNLRSEPAIGDNIICELPELMEVHVTGKNDDWYRIETNLTACGYAYIAAPYLSSSLN